MCQELTTIKLQRLGGGGSHQSTVVFIQQQPTQPALQQVTYGPPAQFASFQSQGGGYPSPNGNPQQLGYQSYQQPMPVTSVGGFHSGGYQQLPSAATAGSTESEFVKA